MKFDLIEKIKSVIKGESNDKTVTLIVALLIGVTIMLVISFFDDGKNENQQNFIYESIKNKENNYNEDYAEKLENKLEEILSEIEGVGEVKVMITLEDTTERVPALNIIKTDEKTREKDSDGGVREVIKENVTQEIITNNEKNSMLILKEIRPKVKGVVIVAEGAKNPVIKEKLHQVVSTVLNIPINKVEVCPKRTTLN